MTAPKITELESYSELPSNVTFWACTFRDNERNPLAVVLASYQRRFGVQPGEVYVVPGNGTMGASYYAVAEVKG